MSLLPEEQAGKGNQTMALFLYVGRGGGSHDGKALEPYFVSFFVFVMAN